MAGAGVANKILGNSRPNLGSYVYLVSVMYNFGAAVLICPIQIGFDMKKGRYAVRRCIIFQRTGCFLVQFLSSISAWKMLNAMWSHMIANPGYVGAYFDFMNGVILHCYSVTLIYFSWFKLGVLDNYIEAIQENSLIQRCDMATWKAKLLPAFFWCLTIYMSFIWLPIVFQINFSSWDGFNLSLEAAAGDMFGNCLVRPRLLGILAIIGKFYHAFFIHLPHNVFGTIGLFCAYNLANEFSNLIKNLDFINDEVLMLYKDYKRVLKSINKILTPFNVHFVSMTLTYHSIHLFDALNATIPLWKVSTYLYILYLINFLYLPVKTLLMVKGSMKKLLKNGQSYEALSKEKLIMILDDFNSDRLAVKGGGYFTINASFSGKVIQQLIYYSMLNTVAEQAIAI